MASLLALSLSLGAVACGPEAPPASSPNATAGADGGAAPSADGAGATNTANPTPSDAQGWPFNPGPTAEEKAAQMDRLGKDPGPIKTNWTPPGKSDRYGHAEGLIAAPYDAVRARLADFPHYKDLAGPRFKKVSVVDKQPGGTDIYFQLPIMKGIVTIWYVTRFNPPRAGGNGTEVVEGKFVKGNIKDVHMIFTMRPATEDKKSTVLVCDLLLGLNIPAPQGPLDEELRDACGDAINHVRQLTKEAAAPPPG